MGRVGEVPTDCTSLLLMGTQVRGTGSHAWGAAIDSLGRDRLGRANHLKFQDLLGLCVDFMGRALAHFRKVAKETDIDLVRALAQGRVNLGRHLNPFCPTCAFDEGKPSPKCSSGGAQSEQSESYVPRPASQRISPVWILATFACVDVRFGYLSKYTSPCSTRPVPASRPTWRRAFQRGARRWAPGNERGTREPSCFLREVRPLPWPLRLSPGRVRVAEAVRAGTTKSPVAPRWDQWRAPWRL